jgi:hypothetical protein
MFVCCECCVLSGRGLCEELITRPEESYRLWCVVMCDLETSRMRRPWPALGRSATKKMSNVGYTVWDLSYNFLYYPDTFLSLRSKCSEIPERISALCVERKKNLINSRLWTWLRYFPHLPFVDVDNGNIFFYCRLGFVLQICVNTNYFSFVMQCNCIGVS